MESWGCSASGAEHLRRQVREVGVARRGGAKFEAETQNDPGLGSRPLRLSLLSSENPSSGAGDLVTDRILNLGQAVGLVTPSLSFSP